MIVHIVRDEGFVAAMGHRVALHLGGEPELKRRVLGTVAQLDDPPDEIRFARGPEDGDADEDPEEEPDGPREPAAVGAAPEPKRGPAKGKPPPRRRR
jgi:hypothetical protein